MLHSLSWHGLKSEADDTSRFDSRAATHTTPAIYFLTSFSGSEHGTEFESGQRSNSVRSKKTHREVGLFEVISQAQKKEGLRSQTFLLTKLEFSDERCVFRRIGIAKVSEKLFTTIDEFHQAHAAVVVFFVSFEMLRELADAECHKSDLHL